MSAELVYHRPAENLSTANKSAIVFVHGFSGDARATWGKFPSILEAEPSLSGWDILSLGFSSRLRFDFVGIWAADPDIRTIADYIRTTLLNADKDYESVVLIGHSMGGLAIERALVDSPSSDRGRFLDKVRQVFLFGTPSAGLRKASLLRWFKPQTEAMTEGSKFLTDLRRRWDAQFAELADGRPFRFTTAAGDRDEFVPRSSSIDSFPPTLRAVVPGNHLQIVKPDGRDNLSVQVVVSGLTRGAAPAGMLDSAHIASEASRFRGIIKELGSRESELDDQALVTLALALDGDGQRDEAIRILREQKRDDTDVLGVLAGRLKRRWLASRARADAEEAMRLYSEGLERAQAAENAAQIYYHAINVAFLERAYAEDEDGARAMAEVALAACAVAPASHWRHATEGEANLVLRRFDDAIRCYGRALELATFSRDVESIYQQAALTLAALPVEEVAQAEATAARLDALFQTKGE